jgi:hypothetical protein
MPASPSVVSGSVRARNRKFCLGLPDIEQLFCGSLSLLSLITKHFPCPRQVRARITHCQKGTRKPVPSLLGPVGVKRFQVFPSVWC